MLAWASALLAAAFAAQGAQDDNVIARVIVTAERRPEDIQTVPLSVAALSRDDLQSLALRNAVAGATHVMNAAAARMRGLELDLEYTPSRSLRLGAGLALLHGRYTDFKNAPINVPTRDVSGALIGGNTVLSGDATGSHTVRSPELSTTLHGRYSVPTQVGEFGFNAAYFRDSGFVWDPDNRLRERARGFLNAAIDWTAPGEALSLRAAASNLTDTESCLYATATGLGDLCSPRAPRVFSLEVSMKF